MAYVRNNMIQDLKKKGINSTKLLEALAQVPRHMFVSEAFKYRAYEDVSLPIGFGQTVSRPYVIALMIQSLSLRGKERVLEIGTGSGYQAALLSRLCSGVVSMERVHELSTRARDAIFMTGCSNVKLIASGDFSEAEGLFDAIVVAAGADKMPDNLINKLTDNGTLLIPIAGRQGHLIRRYIKSGNEIIEDEIGGARFVPLITEMTA